ncbi:hypothetical protein ALC53_05729 [Atta colombica]|uniref:Uncharacterized protein n=1 Tax=Atta colombica TaxID=520822 RepID=A0A195BHW2_9HYME|nr:hypothetical protein ALC53_05729 [Atta colombica]
MLIGSILVINFQVVQQRPVRLDPACGRASALHLHPVKCRKLVKAQAVMCRIASCINEGTREEDREKGQGEVREV